MSNEVIISRDDNDVMFAALRAIGRHLAELAKTPGHEGTVIWWPPTPPWCTSAC